MTKMGLVLDIVLSFSSVVTIFCKLILHSFASCLYWIFLVLQIEDEREISDEEAVNTNGGPVSMVLTAPVQATLVTVSCKYSLHLQNTCYLPEESFYTKH